MLREDHICRLSSAAEHYATEGEKTKDTGRSANLVFVHLIDQGATLLVSHPSPSFTHPKEEPPCDSDTEQASATPNGPQERRGDVTSWQSFAKSKWPSKHPWLVMVFTVDTTLTQEAPLEAFLLFL